MSKFLKNFEIEKFDDASDFEQMKKKGKNLNPAHKKSKSNKPKRGKSDI